MKGFKGFDKDLKCRGFQYAIGETTTHDGTVSLCNRGLHFCESPLDTFTFYKPESSRYAEVEADGVSDSTEKDSKRVAKSLHVKAELKIPALVKAAVEFVFQKVKPSEGNSAHSATTGYSAHSATTGNYAHSATTGYYAHSATTGDSARSAAMGKQSIAASLGHNGAAKGPKGGWLVLSEIGDDLKVKAVGVARVDGKKIKADTYYQIRGGKFVEA